MIVYQLGIPGILEFFSVNSHYFHFCRVPEEEIYIKYLYWQMKNQNTLHFIFNQDLGTKLLRHKAETSPVGSCGEAVFPIQLSLICFKLKQAMRGTPSISPLLKHSWTFPCGVSRACSNSYLAVLKAMEPERTLLPQLTAWPPASRLALTTSLRPFLPKQQVWLQLLLGEGKSPLMKAFHTTSVTGKKQKSEPTVC